MLIRERMYETEREILSPFASLCINTRGRELLIEESPIRTEYMRDRDRIIHSKSWRRLKDKTQVFVNPSSSHYRTRLTHTLEVSQLARTIAKALKLNEDLTEAIALGHDLGHTPFGHSGERGLASLIAFEHNIQSLRVVEKLETLNLTWEVRDGILNHRRNGIPSTLEGMAVNHADRIAYLNHDIDDALRAGIICVQDLPKDCIEVLGDTYSSRINTMITDIVINSMGKRQVAYTKPVAEAADALRKFLFENVYVRSVAEEEEQKIQDIIALLYRHFLDHPDELPETEHNRIEEDGLPRCVADHIAGMTDQYAISTFERIYIPRRWTML